jgi:hypothetical protein
VLAREARGVDRAPHLPQHRRRSEVASAGDKFVKCEQRGAMRRGLGEQLLVAPRDAIGHEREHLHDQSFHLLRCIAGRLGGLGPLTQQHRGHALGGGGPGPQAPPSLALARPGPAGHNLRTHGHHGLRVSRPVTTKSVSRERQAVQRNQRGIAVAAGDEASQIGVGLVPARLAPDQHAGPPPAAAALLARSRFKTPAEARNAVFDFIGLLEHGCAGVHETGAISHSGLESGFLKRGRCVA